MHNSIDSVNRCLIRKPGRRDVLKGLAGAAVATLPVFQVARAAALRVGVVGAGIVGTAIAFELAKSGAAVTLFEKSGPAKGATGKSFAWLNAFSEDAHYRDLRLQSLAAYRDLDQSLELGITWGGALLWQRDPGASPDFKVLAPEFTRNGYPMRTIDAREFGQLAPHFTPGHFDVAIHGELDGHLDPVLVTHKFLEQATNLGASLLSPCRVTALNLEGDRLVGVTTTCGDYPLDRLVIAGGTDTPGLCAQAGYTPPLRHAPGILAHSAPVTYLAKTVNYGPGIHFKQFPNGRIVGADSETPPETEIHVGIRDHMLDFPDDSMRDLHGNRILAKIADVFPGARDARLGRLTLGYRPMPQDGFPIVGFVPGSSHVYVAVMHSGVTLAPIMGQTISREILDDSRLDVLAPYRPERFNG